MDSDPIFTRDERAPERRLLTDEPSAFPAHVAPLLHAYVLLGVGVTLAQGSYNGPALLLALAAFALVLLAIARSRRPAPAQPPRDASLRWIQGGLSLLAGAALIRDQAEPLGALYLFATRAVPIAAVLLLGVHAGAGPRWRRRAFFAIVAAELGLWLLAPHALPRPLIDVWQLQQSAVENLFHGRNPYTTPVVDIYRGQHGFGVLSIYSYLPLNLLLSIPGWLCGGDYRYSLIASLAGALVLLRAAGRRLGVDDRRVEIVLLFLVLHPRALRLVAYGWNEPFLVLALAAFVYLQVRAPGGVGQALALASLPALKQYFAVPLLAYLPLLRPRLRSVAIALVLVAALAAPFLVWNFRALIDHGLLLFVQHVGFRPDALSIWAPLHAWTGFTCGGLPAMVVQGIATLLGALLIGPRGLGGFLLTATLALFATFLVGAQAFLNYYFFVGALLLASALVLSAGAPALELEPPGVARGIARSLAALLLLAVVGAAIFFVMFTRFCNQDARAARARLAAGRPVLDEGDNVARPDERIFLCASRHCLSGRLCHDDLSCYCAPAAVGSLKVARALAPEAACTLEKERPSPDDRQGACQRAHCERSLVEPP